MALIAGIDEAGFGPVLGPLVVTAAAIHVPDERVDEPLWSVLASAVSRRPDRRGRKLAYADSKKLYNRKSKAGLEHLERGVLGMLATRKRTPESLRALAKVVAPGVAGLAGGYPWYAALDLPLPHRVTATSVALAGNVLARAMDDQGVRLDTIRSEVVLAGEYNRLVAASENKSATLLDVTSRLLVYLWGRCEDGRILIFADRQGGRKHYRTALQRLFPTCEMKVLDESETVSGYRLTDGPREAEVYFSVGGEERTFSVALASMTCKYLRELFLVMLNAFWAREVAGLAPTAGYYVDGRRFFQEIQPAIERLGVDPALLYRSR